MSVKVSVIIPVYKAEKYIEKCCETLFQQTLGDVDYIFVNDCTPDKSIEILKDVLNKYQYCRDRVKIITHEKNFGVSQSRQDGVDHASGDYIIHCDPDDWVEPDMYELMYEKARKTNADIVICDFMVETAEDATVNTQLLPSDKHEIFRDVNKGYLHAGLCNKLVKRTAWDELNYRFNNQISLWEDMSVVLPLLLSTSKVEKIDMPLYHYRWGASDTISSYINTKEKVQSMIAAADYVGEFLSSKRLLDEYRREYLDLRLKACDGLVSRLSCLDPELWRRSIKTSLPGIINSNLRWTHKIYWILAKMRADKLIYQLVKLKSGR